MVIFDIYIRHSTVSHTCICGETTVANCGAKHHISFKDKKSTRFKTTKES